MPYGIALLRSARDTRRKQPAACSWLLPPFLACYHGSPPGVPPYLAQTLARKPSRRLLASSWLSQVRRRAPKRNARWIPPLQPSKSLPGVRKRACGHRVVQPVPRSSLSFCGIVAAVRTMPTATIALLLRWSARENRVSHPRFPSPSNQHTKYFRHPSPRPAVGLPRYTLSDH